MKTTPYFTLGLLSGTSCDAIDAALVLWKEGQPPQLIATHSGSIPDSIRRQVALLGESRSAPAFEVLQTLGCLDHQLGLLFAEAALAVLRKAHIPAQAVRAIGSHGQTVFHAPQGPYPFTLQLGDPNLIAKKTGILTVADFRRADMAVGGQGAPLIPPFHQQLFQSEREWRVILNLGGIANLTLLAPSSEPEPLRGWDTGPGNALLDRWAEHHLGTPYDKNGAFAARGNLLAPLLEAFLDDPYFQQAPPKSTGREYFHLEWLASFGVDRYAPADVQATLAELTARTIAQALPKTTQKLIVVGGGAHNQHLLSRIQAQVPAVTCLKSSLLGMPEDWVEALFFAWLAKRRIEGLPANAPEVTGARCPTQLGGVFAP